MSSVHPSVDEVQAEFLDSTGAVPRDAVLRWMVAPDLEVLGVVHFGIVTEEHRQRIEPPLELEDEFRFRTGFYARCFREHRTRLQPSAEPEPDYLWSNSNIEAQLEAVEWFRELWTDPAVPREWLARIRDWLADLLQSSERSGDMDLVESLSVGMIEDLLRDQSIARFFEGWRKDPGVIGAVYADALAYIRATAG